MLHWLREGINKLRSDIYGRHGTFPNVIFFYRVCWILLWNFFEKNTVSWIDVSLLFRFIWVILLHRSSILSWTLFQIFFLPNAILRIGNMTLLKLYVILIRYSKVCRSSLQRWGSSKTARRHGVTRGFIFFTHWI